MVVHVQQVRIRDLLRVGQGKARVELLDVNVRHAAEGGGDPVWRGTAAGPGVCEVRVDLRVVRAVVAGPNRSCRRPSVSISRAELAGNVRKWLSCLA